jgi:RNA processing factor Prp31
MENLQEHPFYPELTEAGKVEAQELLNKFKTKAKSVLDNLLDDYLGEVYCNILPEIESDSWSNYRNTVIDAYKNYLNKDKRDYDFKEIRQKIYLEYKEQIDADLNQDNLDKIKKLEKEIEQMREYEQHRRNY